MRGCLPLLGTLLVLGVFLPWVIFLVLAVGIVLFLVFVPLGFAAQSLFWLVSGPSQLYGILTNPRVRRNHALEHATVHVLEERHGPLGISGLAFENGFTVRGDLFDAATVLNAARIALRRLQSGEKDLAVHPRCGTTAVVANLLAAVVFLALLILTGRLSLMAVLVALVAAQLVGPSGGLWVQRHITTDAEVSQLEILGVELQGRRGYGLGGSVVPEQLLVVTRMAGAAGSPEVGS